MNEEEKVQWVAERLKALHKLADEGTCDLAIQLRRASREGGVSCEEAGQAFGKLGMALEMADRLDGFLIA